MDIFVRQANVILAIPKEQKDEYVSRGFDVVTESGVVVEAAIPYDVPTLQSKLKELQDENANLRNKIVELTSNTAKRKDTSANKKKAN